MVELTSEQEELLKDLIDRTKSGEPAGEYIHRVRNPRLNSELECQFTGQRYSVSKEYEEIEPLLGDLKRYDLLEPFYLYFDDTGVQTFPYGDLTSKGKSYFDKKAALAKEARNKKWGDRMWQVFIAVLGVVLSVIASIITVNIKLGQ
ncbi:MAG: hypothetical protein RR178_09420 [Gordonibacter sp.]